MTGTRPRVVVVTTASVDGRITTRRSERLLDDDVRQRWQSVWPPDVTELEEQRRRWLAERYAPRVTLEGSGSFVGHEAGLPFADPDPGDAADDVMDHLPRRTPAWFVVIDGRGRVDWRYTGDDETSLLVVVCRATPPRYRQQLRDKGIGYLRAGDTAVDLATTIERLGEELGARTVVCEGGGGLNGALLRAGLVDELHVITFPALVGGLGTPSMVDGPPLEPGGTPVALRPRGLVQGHAGSVWSWYDVGDRDRSPAPSTGVTSGR